MIDERNKIIYYDFTTGNTFQACKEKARLNSVLGWKLKRADLRLDFGHAIHAGWAAYYDALAGGWRNPAGLWQPEPTINPVVAAQAAFIRDLGVDIKGNISLPITLESNERRSLERGMALLRGYIRRWQAEPFENILRADGSPLVEVGFKFPLAHYAGYDIVHVGYIDRIMRSRLTGRPAIVEGKTTTQGLDNYINHVKPNNQITTYFMPANALMNTLGLPEIKECVWDCMFISNRKPDMKKALLDPLWAYGVDTAKDFKRQTTTRSATDISELLIDAESVAIDYAKWLLSGVKRWPRSTGACHQYGGCQFRDRCSMNLDEVEEAAYMQTNFHINKWEPWRKIVESES